ncbi:MAG TPA: thioredoxin family protein [Bacteroidota bacterium]|nr:thioredoxin family protein [Bacteroidota bacterium]
MRHLLLFLGIVFSFVFVSVAQEIAPVHKHPVFDAKRDAAKDIQNALVLAKQTNKRVLLDVGGNWCVWCHLLDSLFVANRDLDEYLFQHYVVVKINVSPENKNENVLANYPKIKGYPHLFVLDENGKVLKSQDTGVLENKKGKPKGHDKDKVFAFLKKWAKE